MGYRLQSQTLRKVLLWTDKKLKRKRKTEKGGKGDLFAAGKGYLWSKVQIWAVGVFSPLGKTAAAPQLWRNGASAQDSKRQHTCQGYLTISLKRELQNRRNKMIGQEHPGLANLQKILFALSVLPFCILQPVIIHESVIIHENTFNWSVKSNIVTVV